MNLRRLGILSVVSLSSVILLAACADTTSPTGPAASSPMEGSSTTALPLGGPDAVLTGQGGVAGQLVTLCHATGRGSDAYVEITVSVAAEAAHRAHGDGAVGDPVPGQEGMEFDPNCMPAVSATLLRWTLNQVAFTDGGTATGYFDLDADTSTIVAWSISVAGGDTGTFPPFTYSSSLPNHVSNIISTFAPDGEGTIFLNPATVLPRRLLRIDPVAFMTSAGGIIPLSTEVNANVECFNCSPFRAIDFSTNPYVSGAPIPAP